MAGHPVTSSADDNNDGAINPAGKIWEQMASTVVAAEFDRKKTHEGRGTTILTTSGSFLTLIFGLTVVASGKDTRSQDPWATMLLIASLLTLVVSVPELTLCRDRNLCRGLRLSVHARGSRFWTVLRRMSRGKRPRIKRGAHRCDARSTPAIACTMTTTER